MRAKQLFSTLSAAAARQAQRGIASFKMPDPSSQAYIQMMHEIGQQRTFKDLFADMLDGKKIEINKIDSQGMTFLDWVTQESYTSHVAGLLLSDLTKEKLGKEPKTGKQVVEEYMRKAASTASEKVNVTKDTIFEGDTVISGDICKDVKVIVKDGSLTVKGDILYRATVEQTGQDNGTSEAGIKVKGNVIAANLFSDSSIQIEGGVEASKLRAQSIAIKDVVSEKSALSAYRDVTAGRIAAGVYVDAATVTANYIENGVTICAKEVTGDKIEAGARNGINGIGATVVNYGFVGGKCR